MRYEIRTGKFGCYFYDTSTETDVTLQHALSIMNETDVLRAQVASLFRVISDIQNEILAETEPKP